jgi:hypothetical protein
VKQGFGRTIIFSLLIGLLVFGVIARLEIWAEHHFKPITFNPKYKHQIQRERPDIICVGNSMLGSNIVKKTFVHELSKAYGRPIRATFIIAGGLHTAWQYLVLKNQIATAAKKGTPVVFFDYEDYYIRPEANTTATGKSEVQFRENMLKDEPFFRSRIGSNGYYFASGFPYLYSQRFLIKRALISESVMGMLTTLGIKDSIRSRKLKKSNPDALSWLLGSVYKGSAFRGGQADDKERNDRVLFQGENEDAFEKKFNDSFLPAMLSFDADFPLTFILSSSNSSMPLVKSSIGTFAERLGRHIEAAGGTLINMNTVQSVQAHGLMHDSRHFTKGRGRDTNTKAVVEQLVLHKTLEH